MDRTVLDLYRHDVDAPRPDHYVHWTPAGARRLSTEEFFTRTCSLADALSELGVAAGDRVMLLSDDRPEWHTVDLAVLDLGAVDVPIYATLTADQIAYQARDSGAVVAIVESSEHMEKFLAIRDRCPELRHLIQIEGAADGGVLAFDELAAPGRSGSEGRFWERASAIAEKNLMTIIYTSGTTGEPKGVMLTHENLVQNALFTCRRVTADPSDVALEFLPLCHVAERLAGYCYMLRATAKAYCSLAHVATLLQGIRPSLFFAAPRVYEKVYLKINEQVAQGSALRRSLFRWALDAGHADALARLAGHGTSLASAIRHRLADRLVLSKVRAAFGGRLRYCISGAAELPAHVASFFMSVGIPILDAYGLTETSPVVAIGGLEPGYRRIGAVGLPLSNLEVKLADDGELLVRGPSVMSGYWNKPDQTAEAFDAEGFFRTGDIATMDGDGFIAIVDRKKDIIVTSGGKNVAPQPIESALQSSPYVDIAVLIGDGRPYVAALISPAFEELERWATNEGISSASRDELVAHPRVQVLFGEIVDAANAELARFEQVRRFRVLAAALSIESGHLTPTLKVRRRAVAKDYATAIEGMYAATQT